MPFAGSWVDLGGTNYQVALRLDDTTKISGSHEPPQYSVMLLGEESLTVHVHDFLDRSERFWLNG